MTCSLNIQPHTTLQSIHFYNFYFYIDELRHNCEGLGGIDNYSGAVETSVARTIGLAVQYGLLFTKLTDSWTIDKHSFSILLRTAESLDSSLWRLFRTVWYPRRSGFRLPSGSRSKVLLRNIL
jgi:hypothetical protein